MPLAVARDIGRRRIDGIHDLGLRGGHHGVIVVLELELWRCITSDARVDALPARQADANHRRTKRLKP
jgi:hypothetical protein